MTSLDVQELTKEYGRTRAVDRLTVTVRPGRVTGFLGPNGAGKSTTMRLLLGLARPTSGSALIGGRRYAELAEPLRHVGALLDADHAHPARTARDHLRILARSNRIAPSRADAVLEEIGLASAAARRVRTFSLGMRQRLGIAAALLGDPPVLMLDEPSNGLDPEGIIHIRELMTRLAREGRTVLVSSHLMHETASFADHLVVLGRGRLLADTPLPDFLDAHTRPRVRLRTPEGARLRDALARDGITLAPAGDRDSGPLDGTDLWAADGVRAADIGPVAAREGVPLLELADERPGLEDAYLALTADEGAYAVPTATPSAHPPIPPDRPTADRSAPARSDRHTTADQEA